jgi:nitrite reductase/ring-hydroxylating ferredoxin subunit
MSDPGADQPNWRPNRSRVRPPNPDLVAERIERLTTDARVTRRDYLKTLGVLSGGLAAGSLAVALGAFKRRTQGASRHQVITSQAASVPVGGQVRFQYPTSNDPAVLLRLGPDRFVAYSAVCTHLSCEVLWRQTNGQLFCPCHNGHFDPATGNPIAGPPKRPLPQIRIAQQGDTIVALGEGRIREPGQ